MRIADVAFKAALTVERSEIPIIYLWLRPIGLAFAPLTLRYALNICSQSLQFISFRAAVIPTNVAFLIDEDEAGAVSDRLRRSAAFSIQRQLESFDTDIEKILSIAS